MQFHVSFEISKKKTYKKLALATELTKYMICNILYIAKKNLHAYIIYLCYFFIINNNYNII